MRSQAKVRFGTPRATTRTRRPPVCSKSLPSRALERREALRRVASIMPGLRSPAADGYGDPSPVCRTRGTTKAEWPAWDRGSRVARTTGPGALLQASAPLAPLDEDVLVFIRVCQERPLCSKPANGLAGWEIVSVITASLLHAGSVFSAERVSPVGPGRVLRPGSNPHQRPLALYFCLT